jgi:tetratricopeptide (TPR) repeat protein
MVEKAAVPEKDWNTLFDDFFSRYSKKPEDHKIVIRLSLVQYERRQYAEALERAKEAARLRPDCPLATWAKACAIQMLNRHRDSLSLFDQLTKIKPEVLSNSCCVGGKARANGLIADAIYRMSLSLQVFHNLADLIHEPQFRI